MGRGRKAEIAEGVTAGALPPTTSLVSKGAGLTWSRDRWQDPASDAL